MKHVNPNDGSPPAVDPEALARSVSAAISMTAQICACVMQLDSTVVFWNRGAEALFGWSAAEVVGKPTSLIAPEHLAEILDALRRVYSGKSFRTQTNARKRNGTPLELSIQWAPVTGSDGRVDAALLLITDASAVNRAQRIAKGFLEISSEALRMRPLPKILDLMIELIESLAPDLRVTIDLNDRSEAYAKGPPNNLGMTVQAIRAGDHELGRVRVITRPVRHLGSFEGEVIREATALASVILDRYRDHGQLQHLALHDPLTGLPNRLLAEDRLAQALTTTQRGDRSVGVLLIDFDDFKGINDTYGHHVGDIVLKTIAKRLASCLRAQDTLARLGGDEFMAILQNIDGPVVAEFVAKRMIEVCQAPLEADGHELRIAISIGLSCSRGAHVEAMTLRIEADRALYRAKQRGGTYALASALRVMADNA